jgi:hypothetical protein
VTPKKQVLHSVSKQNSLSVLKLDLYFLSCLGTSGCHTGDWGGRLKNPRFSLQLRRPNKKVKGNMTQKKQLYILYPSPAITNKALLSFQFIPNHRLSDLILSCYGWVGRCGSLTYMFKVTQTLINFLF